MDDIKYKKIIGQNIKKFRLKNQISQTELAFILNIPSQSKISSWESGFCVPNLIEAQNMATVFKITIMHLLEYSK